MAFRVSICLDEDCDKCKKPMTEGNPGVQLYVATRASSDRNFIWLHIKCLEWGVLHKANRLLRERKEAIARAEKVTEVGVQP